MERKKFKIETQVINKLLRLIKKHQKYLTKKPNLPQLAKLGFIYNTLWYAGRLCWGYEGIIQKLDQNEDNPKYKIEMCDPMNDDIENLIYDAWSMHVSNELNISWKEFESTILGTIEISENELEELNPKKSFDDWVDIFTDKDYKYSSLFPNRKKVAEYLLLCYGTGYDYNPLTGRIIKQAGGADMDEILYGNWKLAKFDGEIGEFIESILNDPNIKLTITSSNEYITNLLNEQRIKEENERKELFSPLLKHSEISDDPELINMIKDIIEGNHASRRTPIDEYKPYYPYAKGFSRIDKFDDSTHISYINAGIEMCEDILAHENEEDAGNVNFARKFLKKFKK